MTAQITNMEKRELANGSTLYRFELRAGKTGYVAAVFVRDGKIETINGTRGPMKNASIVATVTEAVNAELAKDAAPVKFVPASQIKSGQVVMFRGVAVDVFDVRSDAQGVVLTLSLDSGEREYRFERNAPVIIVQD